MASSPSISGFQPTPLTTPKPSLTAAPKPQVKVAEEPRERFVSSDMAQMLEDIERNSPGLLKSVPPEKAPDQTPKTLKEPTGEMAEMLENIQRAQERDQQTFQAANLTGLKAQGTGAGNGAPTTLMMLDEPVHEHSAHDGHGHGHTHPSEHHGALGGHLGLEAIEHQAHHAVSHGAAHVSSHAGEAGNHVAHTVSEAHGKVGSHVAHTVSEAHGKVGGHVAHTVSEAHGKVGGHVAQTVGDAKAELSGEAANGLAQAGRESGHSLASGVHELGGTLATVVGVGAAASGALGVCLLGVGVKEMAEGIKAKNAEHALEGLNTTIVGTRSGLAAASMASMVTSNGVIGAMAGGAQVLLAPLGVLHGAIDVGLGTKDVVMGVRKNDRSQVIKGSLSIGMGGCLAAAALGGGLPAIGLAAVFLGGKVVQAVAQKRAEKAAAGAAH